MDGADLGLQDRAAALDQLGLAPPVEAVQGVQQEHGLEAQAVQELDQPLPLGQRLLHRLRPVEKGRPGDSLLDQRELRDLSDLLDRLDQGFERGPGRSRAESHAIRSRLRAVGVGIGARRAVAVAGCQGQDRGDQRRGRDRVNQTLVDRGIQTCRTRAAIGALFPFNSSWRDTSSPKSTPPAA